MSVHGDLAATLVSRFQFSWECANEIVQAVLKSANDPNFAYAYAREEADPNTLEENERMLDYWDVVRFLQKTAREPLPTSE